MTIGKDRKPKIFLVYHKPSKHRQAEADRLSVMLRHLPENLSSFTVTCPICKAVFSPDWFKKHPISMAPVKPRYETNRVEYAGPKRWILQSVSQQCSRCGDIVSIPLPVNKMRTRGSLFGDDAQREHKGRKVYIYSLVGADQSLLPEFEKKVKGLKARLTPCVPTGQMEDPHEKYVGWQQQGETSGVPSLEPQGCDQLR